MPRKSCMSYKWQAKHSAPVFTEPQTAAQRDGERVPNIVHLFPDTNAFVQCRPLDQVDWSAWAEFDEVRMIVTRPVQNEIDKHKNKGSDRLAKRARLASSLFREIIKSSDDTKVIRETGPTIKLYLRPDL